MTKFEINPVLAGLVPNPMISYRLRNGVLETVSKLGARGGNVAIDGADFSLSGGGVGQLGVGTITITGKNNQTLVWANVPNAVNVRNRLVKLAGAGSNETSQRAEASSNREIPADIEFGDRVLVFPPLHREFDRPLWLTNPSLTGKFTETHRKLYEWVEVGDKIGTIRLRRSLWKSIDPISIYAPVSGIILYNNFFHWGEWDGNPIQIILGSILLPKDAPVPDDCRVFDHLYQYLEDNRTNIFLKPQEFGGHYDDERVLKLLNEQRRRQFITRPFFIDYPNLFEDILKRKPELAGRLSDSAKNTINQKASPAAVKSAAPETPEWSNAAEKQALSDKQLAALQRYEIAMPFSETELQDKYRFWSKGPESLRAQVNADYETLLPLAV